MLNILNHIEFQINLKLIFSAITFWIKFHYRWHWSSWRHHKLLSFKLWFSEGLFINSVHPYCRSCSIKILPKMVCILNSEAIKISIQWIKCPCYQCNRTIISNNTKIYVKINPSFFPKNRKRFRVESTLYKQPKRA